MTNRTAAFSATYSDWKLIRTRAVVQIVLEVPVEQADHAYNVLGGMPNSAKEIWVGVARFKPGTEVMPTERSKHPPTEKPPASEDSTTPARARKSWHEMPPTQQAGILCREPTFIKFLGEEVAAVVGGLRVVNSIQASAFVRELCGVTSRSEIEEKPIALKRWDRLVSDYRAWMREPEFVP